MPIAPTDEQQRVLAASGRVVLINARAGTGKTATLRMVAEKHSNCRILYLAFNKRAGLEAEGTFPGNVHTSTIHSLEGTISSISGDKARVQLDHGTATLQESLSQLKRA